MRLLPEIEAFVPCLLSWKITVFCSRRWSRGTALVPIRCFRWAHPRNRIKLTDIMGAYKGRVRLRQRKRRSAKDQRIKVLAAIKRGTTPPPDAVEPKIAERLSAVPLDTDEAAQP